MSLKTLIVYHDVLYNILDEIDLNNNFKIINAAKNNINIKEFDNYLSIILKKDPRIQNQVLLSKLPIKIKKLIEVININFLKTNYNLQSKIAVGIYELNLNSRILSLKNNNLDLTEMESNVILFLNNASHPIHIKELQKKVWKHVPNLETHTVETHIYRLRKKIKDKFDDDYFINSTKNGYEIKKKQIC